MFSKTDAQIAKQFLDLQEKSASLNLKLNIALESSMNPIAMYGVTDISLEIPTIPYFNLMVPGNDTSIYKTNNLSQIEAYLDAVSRVQNDH